MSKMKLWIFFGIAMLGGLLFHFGLNAKEEIQPPSEKWSKGIPISSGAMKTSPKMIKLKEDFIVTHADGENVKILSVDKNAKIKSEKTFPSGGKNPRDIGIITDGSNLYLNWVIETSDGKNMYMLMLDESFAVKEEKMTKGIIDKVQVSDNFLAIAFEDRMEVKDAKLNKNYTLKIDKTSSLMGTKVKEEYVIAYKKGDGEYYYFTINNEVVSESKLAGVLKETTQTSIFNGYLAIDGKTGYILAEASSKGSFGGVMVLKFSLEEQKYTTGKLVVDGSERRLNNIVAGEEEGATTFLGSSETEMGKKRSQYNIVQVSFKGEEAKLTSLSRTNDFSMYASQWQDTAIFGDAIDAEKINIYMASTRSEFKAIANGVRGDEVGLALVYTIEGLAYGLVFIIIYGLGWITISLTGAGFATFAELKMKNKYKEELFLITCLISILAKVYTVYSISYVRFGDMLPDFLNLGVGITIAIVFSVIVYSIGYEKYKRDIEYNSLFICFLFGLFLDLTLTLPFFVPFIV